MPSIPSASRTSMAHFAAPMALSDAGHLELPLNRTWTSIGPPSSPLPLVPAVHRPAEASSPPRSGWGEGGKRDE